MSATRGLARRIKHHKDTDGTFPYWPNAPYPGSKYTPTGAVIAGRAKCEKKGHVPMPVRVCGARVVILGATFCSRCKEQI